MSIEGSSGGSDRSRARALLEEARKIKFDRTPTSIASEPDYVQALPKITEVYRDIEFWHGTGRYKYSSGGELSDILRSIINEGGLVPHEDEWDRKRGMIESVSVARSRMYARLYAGMYCPASTRISNELGSRELWGYYFFGTSALRGIAEYRSNIRSILRGDDSTSFIPDLARKQDKWIAKVTAQDTNLKDVFLHGTDIAENYPILIGIRSGIVRATHGSKFINLHERRTEEAIPMSGISHVEVPRDRVDETRQVLTESGHPAVEILPIEFGEEYCRKFTFRQLVSGKPLGT